MWTRGVILLLVDQREILRKVEGVKLEGELEIAVQHIYWVALLPSDLLLLDG